MAYVVSVLIGYLLGSLSPSALLSKIKMKNLREHGTKNLGASNAMLVFGKKYGVIVMVIDIAKGFLACKLAKILFPQVVVAEALAGLASVIGHVFPFYLGFKGGKGLAAFGGMVLAYDPWMFLFLLTFGVIMMAIFNYSAVMPMSVAVLFPIMAGVHSRNLAIFLITVAASAIIIVKHWSNIEKGKRGEDLNIRKFIKGLFVKEKTV